MGDLKIIRMALEASEDELSNRESLGFAGLALVEYLREALSALDRIEKQEPVAWMFEFNNGKVSITKHAEKADEIRRYLDNDEFETVLYGKVN